MSILWLIVTIYFVFLMIEDDWITFYQWRFWSKDKWFRCCRIKLHCCRYDGVVSCCKHEGIVMLQNHSYRFVFQLLQDQNYATGSFPVTAGLNQSLQVRFCCHFVLAWEDPKILHDHRRLLLQVHFLLLQVRSNCCRFIPSCYGITTGNSV